MSGTNQPYSYTATVARDNYKSYKVTATTKNINGRVSVASAFKLLKPLPVPYNITDISATAVGSTQATIGVTYFPGTDINYIRSDISGFVLTCTPSGGSAVVTYFKNNWTGTGQNSALLTLTGLTNKTQYTLTGRLENINSALSTGVSPTVTFTPLATPLAPTVIGTEGDARVTLSITAADADKGYVSGFVITKKVGSNPATDLVAGEIADNVIDVNTRSLAVTGLLNGTTYTFGVKTRNTNGVLGAEQTIALTPSVPVPITYKSVSAKGTTAGAVTSTGEVYMWGNNNNGQRGDGTTTTTQNATFATLASNDSNITNAISIACGTQFTCILLSDGGVLTAGDNTNGTLGCGTSLITSRSRFADVLIDATTRLGNVVDIAVGDTHAFAVTASGQVYTWGKDTQYQTGISPLGTTRQYATQLTLPTINGSKIQIAKVAAGNEHSLFLTTTGQVFSVGNNTYGQLGDGKIVSGSTASFTSVYIPHTIVHIEARGNNSLALTSHGLVYGWGQNGSQQIGATGNVVQPSIINYGDSAPLPDVVGMSLGQSHCTFILANGTAVSTGSNTNSQYCNGTTGDSTTTSIYYATSRVTTLSGTTVTTLSNIVGCACASIYTFFLLANNQIVGGGNALNSISTVSDGQTTRATKYVRSESVNPITTIAVRRPAFGNVTFAAEKNRAYSVADILAGPLFQYQPGTVQARGIAVVGFTGSWEYSTTGSTGTYTSIDVASAAAATLLQAHPSVFIRTSVDGASITLKAWDRRYVAPAGGAAYGLAITGVNTTATDVFTLTSFS
jgi:alpha-tubulin suppressor-like RCC1 family protein